MPTLCVITSNYDLVANTGGIIVVQVSINVINVLANQLRLIFRMYFGDL